MLALDRYAGESIIIDGHIEVKVVKFSNQNGNKKVRLGITAPKSISIHRKEIQEAIDRENKQAVLSLIG